MANTLSMGNDWQRLYAELGTQQQVPSDVVDPWAPGRTDYGSAPITQPAPQRQSLQMQSMSAPEIQQPKEPQQQEDEQQNGFAKILGMAAMMSDPQTKVIHDRLTNQFAQSAQPIEYEYNQEAQQRYGMPPGMRTGVDARRIADEGGPMGREVTAETSEGLKVIKPDEGLGAAMATASQAVLTNQQQEMQMKRMMEALDERFMELEMRNRMRSTKV